MQNKHYNILDYGAVGNGKHIDTEAIQQAIDDCAENGGGRVVFPGGYVFRSGTLRLRSYVELHIESGAVLKASDDLADFGDVSGLITTQELPSYANSDYNGAPLLYFLFCKDCTNVSITGLGCIDGNEALFYGKITKWHIDGAFYPRMPLLFLEGVSHVTLHQVTLQNSAFWTVHMVGCSDVLIDGIRIFNNLRMASSDGIDPDHCKNVRIVNCHIESADDCIVLKNTKSAEQYGNCENIVIANCTLKSTSAAIKIGTESEGVFRNIIVQGCCISGTNRGISLQLRDSGSIQNVLFSNLNIETRRFSPDHWWGSGEPIAVTALPRKESTVLGYIKNIRFENINCRSENGILIYGQNAAHIRDVFFSNVSVELYRKTDWPRFTHDLRPTYGEKQVDYAPYYLYAKGASNVQLRTFRTAMDEGVTQEVCENYCAIDCLGFSCED